jgi:hypothetical protein
MRSIDRWPNLEREKYFEVVTARFSNHFPSVIIAPL